MFWLPAMWACRRGCSGFLSDVLTEGALLHMRPQAAAWQQPPEENALNSPSFRNCPRRQSSKTPDPP